MPKKRSPKPPPLPLDTLEKSTNLNRNMGRALLLMLLPALVSTAQISDLQLVENHQTIDLHVMDITLPFSLVDFGYWAPVAILVGHIIFLISLHEHGLKLKAWMEAQGPDADALRKDLPFSLFNLAHINHGWTALPARVLVYVAVFILPGVVLLYVQLRFSDLHDFQLTREQFVLLGLDFALAAWYCRKIARLSSAPKRSRVERGLMTTAFSGLIVTSVMTLWVVWLIGGQCCRYKCVAAYMKGEPVGVIWRMMHDHHFRSAYDARFYKEPEYWLPIPRLEVINKTIQMREPDDVDAPYSPRKEELARDFIFARFKACKFVDARLLAARMMSADLDGVHLEAAIMAYVNFSGSKLRRAHIRYSGMNNANLTEANFQDADLTGSNLMHADLSRTDLRRAILDHTNMSDETHLSGKLLRGASLVGVNLQNAHLENLSLECVNLNNADLQGAIIIRSNLQAANLENTNLRGTTFGDVAMQGANLQGCELQGALFAKCYVNAVNWPSDICEAKATLLDLAIKKYQEKFPTEAELEKTHQELKAINFSTNFLERMHYAKSKVEPKFEYSPHKGLPHQFTEERISLMDICGVRIDHLWMQASSFYNGVTPSYIATHNRALTEHCLKNYPHRVTEFMKYDLNSKFPGAKPDSWMLLAGGAGAIEY